MHKQVESKLKAIAAICRDNHVLKVELFGSATSEHFDQEKSDFDVLVTFEDIEPVAYADAYFGLLEGLQELFNRPVDVVVESALKNPYFIREIQKTRTLLYAA